MRARVLVVVLFLIVVSVVQLGKPIPAYACSCATSTAKQAMDWADVVFRGKVVSVTGSDTVSVRRGSVPTQVTTIVFEVDRVWKGEGQSRVEVHTSGMCGVTYREGDRTVVFAKMQDGSLFTNLCSYERATGEPPDEVALGPGGAVVSPVSSVSVTAEPASYPGEDTGFSVADLIKTAALLVLGVGLILMYRDRRRADSL